MATTVFSQNINSEQANEQLQYFTRHAAIPLGYKPTSINAVKIDEKEAYCFRYAKDTNERIGGEHFSFLVTKDSPYKILGFTAMDSKYADKNQLNKEQTEKIATDFLKKIDISFFEELQLQWIDIHDENINFDGNTKIVRGMKCKYYRPSHKDYAWVIVGYDGSVITFERDILWSNGMQKRITEKWLHDSWLAENNKNFAKTDKKIEATAFLKCKADKIEEFRMAVAELVKETVKEPGCELFKIFQNDQKSDEFILWEIFSNEQAMNIHMNSPHTQKCFALGLFDLVSITHQTEVR